MGARGTQGERLKVLWVIKGLGPGGAERLLLSAATAHDPAQVDLHVAYLLPWKTAMVAPLEAAGVTVHCLASPKALDPRWALRLRRLVRRERFDVVHAHSPMPASFARLVARSVRPRPAVVYTEHNRWASHDPLTRLANRATWALDDAHLAVSKDTKASVDDRARRDLEVLIHGIAFEDVAAAQGQRAEVRAELGLPDDAVVVVTVANFRPQKGYEVLFAAIERVLETEPATRFVCVGQGPQEALMRERHAALGFGDRVVLTGFRPDALRVIGACDVFTLASHYEGYPIALMEALAMGLPVATTAVGGVPDAVTDGVEGFTVPPGDPAALAAAILRLVRSSEDRRTMGAAGRARAADFDIRRTTRRLEALYREVTARTG